MTAKNVQLTVEQDLRLKLLNTLLTTPHRKLEEVRPVHAQMAATDPRFYVRLAAWYFDHGDVRDHKEMFVVTLVLGDFPGHRDVGLALLRQLPPYEVVRVLDFINGRKITRKRVARPAAKRHRSVSAQAAPKARYRLRPKPGVLSRVARFVTGAPAPLLRVDAVVPEAQATETPEPQVRTESVGLFRNPPRSLRTEIVRYLREREADPQWFDGTVLTARKAVKRLYALNHVKPSDRAQRTLFDDDPPADGRLFALRQIARAATPAEQARAILDHAVPYRVAVSVVRQMTPTVVLALVERMTAQELINNVASLRNRGALDNPDVKALVGRKLEAAKTAGRVSAFKTAKAIESAGPSLPAGLKAGLEAVADAQVKARGRIRRPTALLIDKSGSMALAIELGKRIGAMISAVCESELYVYAFDTLAYPIECGAADDLASWERSLAGITAGGGTSCGAAVEGMRLKGQRVEQIILVTDEGENTAPLFVPTLQRYQSQLGVAPSVCVVRVPKSTTLVEARCRQAGVPVDVFQFDGDYYALPNLVPLLTRPSRLELLTEILDYPLPKRKSA